MANSAPASMPRTIVARDAAEVESLRAAWIRLAPPYVDADLDYFLALIRGRGDSAKPHVLLLGDLEEPRALAVGRLEQSPFACRFGYKTVYRPTLKTLRIAHGGIAGAEDDQTAEELVAELELALASGEADVLVVPAVLVGSPLERALHTVPAKLRRQHFVEPYDHHRLVLPATYEDLLASRDRRSRYNLKRQNTMLEKEFGSSLTVEVLQEPGDSDKIFDALERVAATTYQRGLGAGFADSPERRELVRVALEKRWFRAWVLSIADQPVAFWQGNAAGETFFVSSTGYDPEFTRHGVGTYLQMRMFADLCADPNIRIVDFGWGDAPYKSRFGNESWREREVVIFAPSLRGLRVSLIRNAIFGLDRSARRLLAKTGLTSRIKRGWRRRLGREASVSPSN
jgi:hypothetical protein